MLLLILSKSMPIIVEIQVIVLRQGNNLSSRIYCIAELSEGGPNTQNLTFLVTLRLVQLKHLLGDDITSTFVGLE